MKQISDLRNNSHYFWNMQKYLTEMFECIPNEEELFNKKFILLHLNCHTHNEEQYYFPAEIAALEFNLLNGISRTYHQIIGLSKICPRGFAGGMRQFSDEFHQISCWHQHPDDYQNILLEFTKFLKDGINLIDLQEGTLDLPYLYTVESEIGIDMMKTKSSLERLYSTAFPKEDIALACVVSVLHMYIMANFRSPESIVVLVLILNARSLSRAPFDADHIKSVFKIGSIERLLLEIKNKLNLNLDQRNLRSGMSVHEILESEMYGHGLGCVYHEIRDIASKCSKARIIQWMSNICIHILPFTNLQLVPGKHIAIQLRDGSRMIIENADLPLSKQDLKLENIN